LGFLKLRNAFSQNKVSFLVDQTVKRKRALVLSRHDERNLEL